MMASALLKTLPLLLIALFAACDDDPIGPGETLVGTWDLIGFSDAGVPATTSGTAVFRSDGTFEVDGTITFPGEPTDPILVVGTYDQDGSTVDLTIGSETSSWTLSFSGDEVTLTAVEPPTNTITLRRS